MLGGSSSALLQIISAAVTPVVMISACAALILGVNNKHGLISGQIRELLAELRRGPGVERQHQIDAQVPCFYRRFVFTWIALYALFGAVMFFTLTALSIVISQSRSISTDSGTLGLFMAGMALMSVASVCELAEVGLARRTLLIEMSFHVGAGEKTAQKMREK